MTNHRNPTFIRRSLVVAVLVLACAARAEDEPKLEELFPDTTLISIALPNLDAARKSADASRLGELYKQPEMREFLDPLVTRMKEAYAEARAANPMIPTLDELDKGVLSSEIGIALYSRGVGNEPGIVVSIKPKDEKAFDNILNTIFKQMLQGQPFPKDAFPLGDGPNPGGLVYARGRLLMCAQMADLKSIADRVGDPAKRAQGSLAANASFKEASAKMKDSAGWVFVNPITLMALADETFAARGDPEFLKVKAVLGAMGLDKVNALMAGLTFAGGEVACEAYIGTTDGAPKGIFSLVGNKSASKEMLQIAAADAPYVAGGSLNVAQVLPFIRNMVGLLEPNSVKQLDEGLAKAKEMLKFDLEKDLLDNFDSEIVTAQTPHDTGQPFAFSPGLLVAFKLKSGTGPKVEGSLKKIKDAFDAMVAKENVPSVMMRIRTANYKGTQIYYFSQLWSFSGSMVLAVVKDELLYGDSLNAVKRSIDQLGSGSNILSNKSFQASLARVSGQPFNSDKLPLSFAWSEDYGGGGGVFLLTALGVGTGTAAVGGLAEIAMQRRELPDEPGPPNPFQEFTRHAGGRVAMKVLDGLDTNLWPDEEFFIKHRQSHASAGMKMEKGWFSRSEFPPPMPHYGSMSPLVVVSVIAIMAVSLTPAFARAREAGRRSVDADNLKQFHYCLIMYETDHGKMPTDPSELYPKYTDDPRIFQSPRDPDLDPAYSLVLGVGSENPHALIAFENRPPNRMDGRNVLLAGGSVYFKTEPEFQSMLKQAEEDAQKAGRTFKTAPMSMKELLKKGPKKPEKKQQF